MAYCTLTEIQDQVHETTLTQLTDDGQTGVMDEGKVDAAIAAAGEEVDTYLRSRYPVVPLPSPVPGIITRVTRDLAIYEIYSRRGAGGVPEVVKDRAKEARKLLEGLKDGSRSLGIEPVTGSGGFRTNKTAESRIFTDDALRAFGQG